MSKSIVKEKSFVFAIEIARLCQRLQIKKEFVLSNQLLRSGTSVGANIREALNTNTDRDFAYKMSISQRECDETLFWLEILHELQELSESDFNRLKTQALEILKMLKSIVLTMQAKLKKNEIKPGAHTN